MKFASKWEEQYRNMLEAKYRVGEFSPMNMSPSPSD